MAKLLKVLFLGGVKEIGKNMTALEYSDEIIVVDAGMSFPDENTPGVDMLIPDFSYLKANASKVKGVFLTHGHEDHIGAVPFLLKELDTFVPVYGTAMTLAILGAKFDEHEMDKSCLRVVEYGETASVGRFSVEFIKVCHSISGAAALSVSTPQGIVFFTGDYKIDYTPVDGKLTDLARIADIGEKGVLLMLADSTNVENDGHSQSETLVGKNLEHVFCEYPDKRLVITTFSSHNYRVQQIIGLAEKYGRKVVLSGKSMRKLVDIAINLGEIDADPHIFIEQGEAKNYKDGKVVVICAGSQGEPMSALTKMSTGDYGKVKLTDNDLVVMSSSAIPGNERMIYNVVNNLFDLGVDVIYDAAMNMHASGHAFREEMKLMISLLKPRFFAPVHGESRHQVKHAALARSLGVAAENVCIPSLGDAWGFDKYNMRVLDKVTAGVSFVDSNVTGQAVYDVVRDRKSLSESGIVVVIANILKDGTPGAPLNIVAHGIQFSPEFQATLEQHVENSIKKLDFENGFIDTDIKAAMKKAVRRRVADTYRKFPLIVPIVIEG